MRPERWPGDLEERVVELVEQALLHEHRSRPSSQDAKQPQAVSEIEEVSRRVSWRRSNVRRAARSSDAARSRLSADESRSARSASPTPPAPARKSTLPSARRCPCQPPSARRRGATATAFRLDRTVAGKMAPGWLADQRRGVFGADVPARLVVGVAGPVAARRLPARGCAYPSSVLHAGGRFSVSGLPTGCAISLRGPI